MSSKTYIYHDFNPITDICNRCGLQKRMKKKFSVNMRELGRWNEYLVDGKWQLEKITCTEYKNRNNG